MGRITVFTGNDLLSSRVKAILKASSLPFNEVNLSDHPQYQTTLDSLAMSSSVPQVFFNTRLIGGYKQTKREIRKWKKDPKWTALDRYKVQIEAMSDPRGLPDVTLRDMQQLRVQNVLRSHLKNSYEPQNISWPNSTSKTKVWVVIDQLEQSLPLDAQFYKGVTYKRSFSGEQLIRALEDQVQKSSQGQRTVEEMAQALLDLDIAKAVRPEDTTFNKAALYQLYCHATPDVVNSYCNMKKTFFELKSSAQSAAKGIIYGIHELLRRIELDSVNRKGKVNYTKAYLHEDFGHLEYSASKLQWIKMESAFEDDLCEQLAFGINVYHLMLRLAFLKIGIPTNRADQQHFLANVRFNLGGRNYTFAEFQTILVARNRYTATGKRVGCDGNIVACDGKLPFFRRRNRQAAGTDCRIYLAVNQGVHLGCHESLPFEFYSGRTLDRQLSTAASILCSQSHICRVKQDGKVELASFLRDIQAEVGLSHRGLLRFLADTVTSRKNAKLEGALLHPKYAKFVDVDWAAYATNFSDYKKETLIAQVSGFQAHRLRFLPAGKAKDEKIRLKTLYNLGLLDSEQKEQFDRITASCSKDLKMPISLVSLVDRDRTWLHSVQVTCPGDPLPSHVPREESLCGHTVVHGDTFIVNNTLQDHRFANNPLVQGPLGVRFYAGIPLSVPSATGGHTSIGVLCVVDQKPRRLSSNQVKKLKDYGQKAVKEILRQEKHKIAYDSVQDSSQSSACTEEITSSSSLSVLGDFDPYFL